MQTIMTERRQLTQNFFDLKERLNHIDHPPSLTYKNTVHSPKIQNQIRKENIEIDKYYVSG